MGGRRWGTGLTALTALALALTGLVAGGCAQDSDGALADGQPPSSGTTAGGADAGGERSTTTAPTTTTTSATTAPPSPSTEYSDPEVAAEVLDRAPPDPEPPPADTPPDALEVTTLIEGQGRGAAVGDTVVVHYVGATADGQVFDSSWERGQPFPLSLGDGTVIAGWEEGLVGVRVGERRRLVIGSDNAYRSAGSGDGSIPPDAPLAFDVDVIDVNPGGD